MKLLFVILLMSLLTPSCGKWEKMTSKDIKEDCMHMKGDDLELLNCGKATFYAKPEDEEFVFDISDCGEGFYIHFNDKHPPMSFLETEMAKMPSFNLVVLTDGTVTANGNERKKLGTITPGIDGVVKIYVNPGSTCKLRLVKGDAVIESSVPGAVAAAANTKWELIVGIVAGVIAIVLLIAVVYKLSKRTRRMA